MLLYSAISFFASQPMSKMKRVLVIALILLCALRASGMEDYEDDDDDAADEEDPILSSDVGEEDSRKVSKTTKAPKTTTTTSESPIICMVQDPVLAENNKNCTIACEATYIWKPCDDCETKSFSTGTTNHSLMFEEEIFCRCQSSKLTMESGKVQ